MTLKHKTLRHYAPLLFILSIYACWLLVQGVNSALANFVSQISIAITMVFGSFIAGGTALGGGAVAFPVMTKLLGIEPATAKVFSLAIQSFGMTAASVAIIFGGIKYYRPILLVALLGALPGVFISLFFIADLLPRLATKSLFSFFLFIFAITLLRSDWRESCRLSFDNTCKKHRLIVLATAFIGGMVSGLIGSGADVALFALLMLYFKADLKVATATSVLVMAVTSVFASLINYFLLNTIDQQVFHYVLAAIPVVIVGAPLGAYFCAKVSKSIMLGLLLMLISLEVVFTAYEVINTWFVL
jgi:uncharacterized membrane protein YfcA